MHYRVYVDNKLLYDCTFPDKNRKILNATLQMDANEQGYFNFTLPTTHALYHNGIEVSSDPFKKRASIIKINTVDKEGNESWYWEGEIIDDSFDYYNNRAIHVEGALSYLNDVSTMPMPYYINVKASTANEAIRNALAMILDNYNKLVNDSSYISNNRKIYIGDVSGFSKSDVRLIYAGDGSSLNNGYYFFYSNLESFLTFIKNSFVNLIGGYLNIRREKGSNNLVLDYRKKPYGFSDKNNHTVNFHTNLVDLNKSESTEDLFTVLIPRGRVIDQEDKYYLGNFPEDVEQRLLVGYHKVFTQSQYYYAHAENGDSRYVVPANSDGTDVDWYSPEFESLPDNTAFRCRLRNSDGSRYYKYYLKYDDNSFAILTSFMDQYGNGDAIRQTCRINLKTVYNSKKINDSLDIAPPFDNVLNYDSENLDDIKAFYKTYGYIEKVVDFDDAENETLLKEKAYDYFIEKVVKTWFARFKKKSIETVDFSFSMIELNDSLPVNLYDKVVLNSDPHWISDLVRGVTSVTIRLDSPEKNQITVSSEKKDLNLSSY